MTQEGGATHDSQSPAGSLHFSGALALYDLGLAGPSPPVGMLSESRYKTSRNRDEMMAVALL